jgi:hypothetical protein
MHSVRKLLSDVDLLRRHRVCRCICPSGYNKARHLSFLTIYKLLSSRSLRSPVVSIHLRPIHAARFFFYFFFIFSKTTFPPLRFMPLRFFKRTSAFDPRIPYTKCPYYTFPIQAQAIASSSLA